MQSKEKWMVCFQFHFYRNMWHQMHTERLLAVVFLVCCHKLKEYIITNDNTRILNCCIIS